MRSLKDIAFEHSIVRYAHATPIAIIRILLKPENISMAKIIAVSGVRDDAARNDDIEIRTIAPAYFDGRTLRVIASVAVSEPIIAPNVSNGISVPPVIPVFVEIRRINARTNKSIIRTYQMGACE